MIVQISLVLHVTNIVNLCISIFPILYNCIDSRNLNRTFFATCLQELVAEMVANPHVLKATNRSGLFSRLEALQAELTLCEKTLAEYLETKRLAFPRFYFVSTADLLDILSNGNQPSKVTR